MHRRTCGEAIGEKASLPSAGCRQVELLGDECSQYLHSKSYMMDQPKSEHVIGACHLDLTKNACIQPEIGAIASWDLASKDCMNKSMFTD